MKKICSIVFFSIALLLGCCVNAWGYTKTLSNSTDYSTEYAPVYGLKASNYIFTQIIYTSSELTSATTVKDKKITKLTFYVNSSNKPTNTWANMEVRLKEINRSTFASNTDWESLTGATLVYSGTLDATSGTLVITFSTPYVYGGGHLLLDIRNTDRNNTNSTKCKFYGSYVSNSVLYDYNTTSSYYRGTRNAYRPKTMFTYEDAGSSCGTPTGLASSSITQTSATVSWSAVTGATKYEYVRVARNATPSWTSPQSTTGTSVNLTGLTAGTGYDFYVRTVCSSGNSEPAKLQFSTECGIATLDYEPTFSSGVKPNCWDISDDYWDSGWSGKWYTYLVSGTNYGLQYQASSSSVGSTVTTPTIALSEEANLTFDYTNYYSGRRVVSQVIISDGTTTKTINLANTSSTALVAKTIDLTNVDGTDFTGKNITISFKGTKHSSSSGTGYLKIANIKVKAKPCVTPTNLAAVATSDGANVTWTDASGSNWSLRYRTNGSGSWTEVTDISVASYAITGLTPGTTYEVQVKRICSATSSSAWTNSQTFTPTTCPTITGITLSNQTAIGVQVNWTVSGAGTTYNLRYKTTVSLVWTTVNVTGTNYSISNLTPEFTYTIEVKSACESNWTSTTYQPRILPPTPTITPSECGATVVWEQPLLANGYQYLWVVKDATPNWNNATFVATNPTAGNPLVISGLTPNTAYDFYVRSTYGLTHTIHSDDRKQPFTTTSTYAPVNLTCTAQTGSSLTFTWQHNPSGTATQYQYKLGNGSWTTLANNVLTYTATGLSAGTTYTFYVRSYYSASVQSAAVNTTGTTTCGIVSIPWTEAFSSSSLPACWDNTQYTYWSSSYIWQPSTNEYKSSSYSMMLKSYKYSDSYTADLETPSISITDKANLTFYYLCASAFPFSVYMKVNGKETLLSSYNSAKSSWGTTPTTQNIPDTCVGKVISIIFRGKGAGTSGTRNLYLDDVSVIYRPCVVPTNLTAVATTDGANVSWQHPEDGPFDLRYRKYNASPADSWHEVNTINAKNYTLTGLLTDVEYEVQVRAHCSEHRISDWTTSVRFTPQCLTPTALSASGISRTEATISWTTDAGKLRYKIGSGAWTTINVSGTSHQLTGLNAETTYTVQVQSACATGDDHWSTSLNFTTKCALRTITLANPYIADSTSIIGNLFECWDTITPYPTVIDSVLTFSGSTAGQTVLLPAFTNQVSTLTLQFNYKTRYTSAGYGAVQPGYINVLGAFVPVGSPLDLKLNYTAASIEMPAEASNARYIAIQMVNNTGSNNSEVYVKDVVVILTPTCFPPATLSGTVINKNDATFSWTASGRGESWYEYICVPAGDTPDWSLATKVNVLTATIYGLNPQTDYDFYVRSWCAANDQSEVSKATFTTACSGYKEIPFVEDFENRSTQPGTIPDCWTCPKWGLGKDEWDIAPWKGEPFGSNCLRYKARKEDSSHSITNYVATPNIWIDIPAELKYTMNNHYDNGNPGGAYIPCQILIMENGVRLATIDLPNSDGRIERSIDLSAYVGKIIQIYFVGYGGGDVETIYIYVDDVKILPKAHVFIKEGSWSTADNWDKKTVPTIDNDVVIRQPATVNASTKALAKSVAIDRSVTDNELDRPSRNGSIDITPQSELVINTTLRQMDGTMGGMLTYGPTSEDYLVVNTSAAGNGVLAIGTNDGTNRAAVNFYTKAYKDPTNGWINQFIGTPFCSVNDIYVDYHNSYIYEFDPSKDEPVGDENDPRWVNKKRGYCAVPFLGYNILRKDAAPSTLPMAGALCASDTKSNKELTLYHKNRTEPTENVLANSWMAPIYIANMDSVDDKEAFVNCEATIYIFNAGSKKQQGSGWDPTVGNAQNASTAGQYIAIPVKSAEWTNPAVTAIPSMQAFSVLATGAGAKLTLNYNTMVLGPAKDSALAEITVATRAPKRMMASNKPDIMRLQVTDMSGNSDIVYLLMREDFTAGFDNGYDGRKMFGVDGIPQLFAFSEDGNMSISCLPDVEGTALGFKPGEDNMYQFFFAYDGEQTLYLNDLQARASTRISDESTYTFSAMEENDVNRFFISSTPIAQVTTGCESSEYNDKNIAVRKVLINNHLYIIRGNAIYSVTGKAVK